MQGQMLGCILIQKPNPELKKNQQAFFPNNWGFALNAEF